MADAPSRTDRCLLLYFVLPVEFCAAVALMVDWDLIWGVVLDVKWWATTLQFIGALVTALGLLWAYLRATRFREHRWPRIRRWLWRIFGIREGAAVGTVWRLPSGLQLRGNQP